MNFGNLLRSMDLRLSYGGCRKAVNFINTVHQIILGFYVLLTLHLGSVLVNNQLDAQFFFRIYLFQSSTCFEHPCAHHQENQLY